MNSEKKKNPASYVKDILIGGVIGIANIIPGVSGGTMALLFGIYERLIEALKNISAGTIAATIGILRFNKSSRERFKEEMRRIDALFLVLLTIGAGAAIVALASLMTYLLENRHDPTYGFFFGLVAASIAVPYRLIGKKTISCFIIMLLAVTLVVGLTAFMSGDRLLEKEQKKLEIRTLESDSAADADRQTLSAVRGVYLFIIGGVSVSAMILPGISGSFLLLLFGVYFDILKAITERDIPVLAIFALGCVAGLLLFTRLLNFLLAKWHDGTMAFLLGLVFGSLWAIWPFKETAIVGEKTIYLYNTLPGSFAGNEIVTILTCFLGAFIVGVFIRLEAGMKTGD